MLCFCELVKLEAALDSRIDLFVARVKVVSLLWLRFAAMRGPGNPAEFADLQLQLLDSHGKLGGKLLARVCFFHLMNLSSFLALGARPELTETAVDEACLRSLTDRFGPFLHVGVSPTWSTGSTGGFPVMPWRRAYQSFFSPRITADLVAFCAVMRPGTKRRDGGRRERTWGTD